MLFCGGENVSYTFKYASFNLRLAQFILNLFLHILYFGNEFLHVFLGLFPLK